MTKSYQAVSDSNIKKAAHTFANLNQKDANRMLALALNGNEQISSKSGDIFPLASPTNPFPTYMKEFESKLPWSGLPPGAKKFSNCAEAHIWLELMGRGKNPKNYTLVSFNKSGIIAAPCENCAQWVDKAFGKVYRETTSFRKARQGTT